MEQMTPTTYTLVIKKDCPTCALIEPLIDELATHCEGKLSVYVQDDPDYPPGYPDRIDDTSLEFSYRNQIEIVPTLMRQTRDSGDVSRIIGWDKVQWQEFTGIGDLGADLIDFKPGCGSKTQDPGMDELLALKFGDTQFSARQVQISESQDIMEACFERGWSDGLPVVPPTP